MWPPTRALALVPIVLMPAACILLVAGLITPNPLSINFWPGRRSVEPVGIVTLVRHPVLWAFLLWAASHAIANGDLVAVVLFGGLALFSLAGMGVLDRRRRRSLGEERWRSLAGAPFAWPAPNLIAAVLGGVLLYALVLAAHPWLFGVDPLAWLR